VLWVQEVPLPVGADAGWPGRGWTPRCPDKMAQWNGKGHFVSIRLPNPTNRMERNAQPARLDLDHTAPLMARRDGARVVASGDARVVAEPDFVEFGLLQARLAGWKPTTWPPLARRRHAAG
jgi:hypothetical protein